MTCGTLATPVPCRRSQLWLLVTTLSSCLLHPIKSYAMPGTASQTHSGVSMTQWSHQSYPWSVSENEMTHQRRLNERPASEGCGVRLPGIPDQAQPVLARWRQSPCNTRMLWSLNRRPAEAHPSLAAASACQPSPALSRSDQDPLAAPHQHLHTICCS